MNEETRNITVEVTWKSTHKIEIPAAWPQIDSDDIESVLEHEDVRSSLAEMVDWEVLDSGPQKERPTLSDATDISDIPEPEEDLEIDDLDEGPRLRLVKDD